ncbi:helix-turn-helix domain-containing protein [Evansella sp. AB-rgal1]|uniref:helix-turn-helix domain-containing protein n=1 Tax=Evansella sp. AB-rgal1 TaxID=3242696 RepID=UPI00359E4A6F
MKRKGFLNFTLGKVIKSRRTLKGIGQDRLATDAGITIGYLSKVERGLVNPSYDKLYSIAIALGTIPSSISKEVEQEIGDIFLITVQEK